MSFSYDPSTDAGKVRMLITDRNAEKAVFSDEEIAAFLEMNDESVNLAAAQALETMAADEALVLKRITTMDLTTDGPAVAAALRELALELRTREREGGYFTIAEQVATPWSFEERLRKQFQRGSF